MKNIKRLGYIVLIVMVIILSLTIYTNANKKNEENQKEKIFSEVKFVENKIMNLFNTMNNIETRNHMIVSSELSKETTKKSDSGSGSSQGSSGGDSSSSSSGSTKEESSSSGSSSSEGTNGGDEQNNKKFELQSQGVLTNTKDINWDSVKSEVEVLYTSLPSITMDLYQMNINKEDILGFNTQYDKLAGAVKAEKKQETLDELTKVYEFLAKFLRSSEQEELYTTLVETKHNIFKAYAKLDGQNWQQISNDVKNAIDTYSQLLSNTEIDGRQQYNISKGYIMINELQNAVNLKDSSVFLIKYKNLLEEINNL